MAIVTIPFVAWVICGSVKFGVNAISGGRGAFEKIGHGGFPSNHTAIISSVTWAYCLLGEWRMAALAMAILMIQVFDAMGLRRAVGNHAAAINQMSGSRLREIMGHKPLDIAGGLIIGLAVAFSYWLVGAIK